VLQPLLLGRLLLYFKDDGDVTYEEAWLLAGGIVALQAGNAILVNQYSHKAFHTGMKMKVSACSIMFRKVIFYLHILPIIYRDQSID
jgi:ATP-binding cassette, subfamily C (CFTR/MRP), member 4